MACSVASYILGVQEKLEKMSALVRKNLEKSQEQKSQHNRYARQHEFFEGMRFWCYYHHHQANYWQAASQGPNSLKGRVSELMYEVDMADKK